MDRVFPAVGRHNQSNAIDFINAIIDKFPFRIREVRTDNGHEFQAQFHWHVEDLGIRHAYIKLASPQLNGKVERSHRTDEQQLYQLLTYTGDVDLRARQSEWEKFYNLSQASWRIQRKSTLRGSSRTAIIGRRMSHKVRLHYTRPAARQDETTKDE